MMSQKSRLTDDRMIDSICTNDEKLKLLSDEIAQRLKKIRIAKGYSVAELSSLSGVAATIIYRIESKTSSVGFKSLLRLMWALNVSPEKLIPFDEYAHEKTFGEEVETLTCNLTPRQKQYLLQIIRTDLGLLNIDTSSNSLVSGFENREEIQIIKND